MELSEDMRRMVKSADRGGRMSRGEDEVVGLSTGWAGHAQPGTT